MVYVPKERERKRWFKRQRWRQLLKTLSSVHFLILRLPSNILIFLHISFTFIAGNKMLFKFTVTNLESKALPIICYKPKKQERSDIQMSLQSPATFTFKLKKKKKRKKKRKIRFLSQSLSFFTPRSLIFSIVFSHF